MAGEYDESTTMKRICVVVLGDIGRSPRMQYHCLSFAQEGFKVDVVGYGGSKPCQKLLGDSNISVHLLSQPPEWIKSLPSILTYMLKAFWQFMTLLFMILNLQKPDAIFMQNPPAVPTLAVVWCCCSLKSCKMVVDWHNYGFTIMAMSLGPQHPLVRVSKWFEVFFGRKADANLCVTNAMKDDLRNWAIEATVLYDRPPESFRQLSVEERHDFFQKLSSEYLCFQSKNDPDGNAFTKESVDDVVEYRKVRPVLLVSSTSWTEDEDFSVLLEALQVYDKTVLNGSRSDLPRIVCVITGKGGLKDYYAEIISAMQFKYVEFCMPWLTAEDYPKLLGCADIGVCLHKSSSCLDLPMKVVDMFGCGLPVLAYDYKCLSELVQNGVNGVVFKEPMELKHHLQVLLAGFPEHSGELRRLANNLKEFQAIRWHDNWKANALVCF